MSLLRTHFPNLHWWALQVDGGTHDKIIHMTGNQWEDEEHVCNIRATGAACNWQWQYIHQWGFSTVHAEQRSTPHHDFSLYHLSSNGLAERGSRHLGQRRRSWLKEPWRPKWLGSYSTIVWHPMPLQGSPQQSWCLEDSSGHLDLFRLDICNRVRAHQKQQKRTHNGPTMFTRKQGSSSLEDRSTLRTLAKGCHGSLGSSKSPRAQCLILSSWKMFMSFTDMWITWELASLQHNHQLRWMTTPPLRYHHRTHTCHRPVDPPPVTAGKHTFVYTLSPNPMLLICMCMYAKLKLCKDCNA